MLRVVFLDEWSSVQVHVKFVRPNLLAPVSWLRSMARMQRMMYENDVCWIANCCAECVAIISELLAARSTTAGHLKLLCR